MGIEIAYAADHGNNASGISYSNNSTKRSDLSERNIRGTMIAKASAKICKSSGVNHVINIAAPPFQRTDKKYGFERKYRTDLSLPVDQKC
jgi:hypothetical protein